MKLARKIAENTPVQGNIAIIALLYGAVAGALAGFVFTSMHALQALLWDWADQRWMIFPITILAGVAIAFIGKRIPRQTLDQQITASFDLRSFHRGRGLLIALSALIAVVAGGAIGPEAGIIALVTELSALVTLRIEDASKRQLISRVGVDAALGGLYGSPPAGVVIESNELDNKKLVNILAATAGLGGFLLVLKLTHTPSLRIKADIDLTLNVQLWIAILLAAVFASLIAIGYTWLDYFLRESNRISSNPFLTTLAGSVVLACIFTAWPHLRFAGEHELLLLGDDPKAYAAAALVVGAIAKLLAVLITVHSGWKGGVIFPLLLTSSMLGTAVASAAPGDFYGACAIAAIGAMLTLATRKPLLVLFVIIFLVPGLAYIPLLVGIGLGMLLSPLTPEPAQHS